MKSLEPRYKTSKLSFTAIKYLSQHYRGKVDRKNILLPDWENLAKTYEDTYTKHCIMNRYNPALRYYDKAFMEFMVPKDDNKGRYFVNLELLIPLLSRSTREINAELYGIPVSPQTKAFTRL